MRELILPNWHAILVHFPLGLLTFGLLIELLAFLWRRSSVRVAARWMILLGTLALFATATSGMFAFRHVLRPDGAERTFYVLRDHNALTNHQWNQLQAHILWTMIGSGALALVVVVWLGSGDRVRRTLQLPLLVLGVAALGSLVVGAWHSGEAIYQGGLAVARPDVSVTTPQTVHLKTLITPQGLKSVFPPIEVHMFLAGWTMAAALAALGLAIRRACESGGLGDASGETWYETGEVRATGTADLGPESAAEPPAAQLPQTTTPPDVDPTHDGGSSPDAAALRRSRLLLAGGHGAGAPAGRWWLVAWLFAAGTIAAGLWMLRHDAASWQPRDLWTAVEHVKRKLAHVVLGGLILVLTLILAIVARWGRRSKVALGIFAALLALVFAAQVWLGVLLMYDTVSGPPTGFNPPPTNVAEK